MDYQPRSTPIYASLNRPTLIMGVERGLAILNFTLTAAAVMGTKMFHWLIVCAVAHMFMAWLSKKDPAMRKIYIRFAMQASRYDPWPHAVQARNPRLIGFDQGNLC